jgi:DNA-binding CsgD family transcriptional regulator
LIAEAAGCNFASLQWWDRRASWACVRQAYKKNDIWRLHSDDLAPPSAKWRALADRLPAGQWALLDREREAQDPVGRPRVMLAIRQSIPSGADAFFMLNKSGLDIHSAASLSGLVQPMVRLLLPALEVVTQLRHSANRTRQAGRLLDSVRLPLLLLDASVRVLAGNRQGLSLIRRSIATPGHAYDFISGLPSEQFRLAVRRACGLAGSVAGGSFVRRRSDQAPDERLLILPASGIESGSADAAALLIVVRADDQCNPATLLLQQLFGFTPAESRLASLILQGYSPTEAAIQLRVRLATVRSQLSSLLRKAGASKQAELVRRLSPLMMLDMSNG